MAKPENRSQLMGYFGAKQKNIVWSWCAVNEDEKTIYFSVWTDYRNKFGKRERDYYVIQEPHWGVNNETGSFSAARNDHDEKFEKALNGGYRTFGYFVEAKDKNVVPREIANTKTSFVFSLKIERLDDGSIIGYPLNRIEVR
ncbi:MAG: hypothetical protein GY814_03250 [Gammaproteobacteria bacterium]|nr:hypothetical protein [Gammaproteobacteria bacterium]